MSKYGTILYIFKHKLYVSIWDCIAECEPYVNIYNPTAHYEPYFNI